MPDEFLQATVDALGLGSMYALVALGIALVFGVMRLINFAYGDIIVGVAYAAYFARDLALIAVFVVMLLAGIGISLATERVAFRPLRKADPTSMLIASFAVSSVIQSSALATVGSAPRGVGAGDFLASAMSWGPVRVPYYTLFSIIVVVVAVIGLREFLTKTSSGIAMRAASEDFAAARLIGVKANKVIVLAFGISGAVASIVSLFLVAQTGGVAPASGTFPALLGFVAVVVGGMGSLMAAALGGLLIGVLQVVLQYVLPVDLLVFKDALLFGAVLLILVLVPQGLFVRSDPWNTRL